MRLDAYRHTGEPVPEFFCPITKRHGYGELGLTNGHILSQAIKSASPATVIQVQDVDGYFGHTIEPDFVNFANVGEFTSAEFLSGDYIRRPLASFYFERGTKDNAKQYFQGFKGAVNLLLAGSLEELGDTPSTWSLLVHSDGRPMTDEIWGMSMLFRVNDMLFAVTVPCHHRDWFKCLGRYKNFLSNSAMPQTITAARFTGTEWHISPRPLPVRFGSPGT